MAHTDINLTVKIDPAATEALSLANQMVDLWTEQVKNERGYVHDKWKPVDLETRVEAVLKLAEWLLTVRRTPEPRPIREQVTTIFGWNPTYGTPSRETYLYTKRWLQEVRASGRPIEVEGIELAEALIRVYEDAQPQAGPLVPPKAPAVVHTATHMGGVCPGPPECM